MFTIDHHPELHDPVMIVGFSGWVDAGIAGATALSFLAEQLDDADEFGAIELANLMDLQQTRPVAHWADDGNRVIEWPRITWVSGKLGRDVVIVSGPEPSLQWPAVVSAIVSGAKELGVRTAYTLAGMPAILSHRRPVPVLATATQRSLAQEIAPLRGAYGGPTGLQTIVQRALGDADIPAAGLWAQVPQYVSGSPSPPAARALVQRLAELARLEIDLSALDARSDAYVARVDEGLAARPDVREIVDRIDREQVGNADDLVSEIERFLRSQGDE